jgi:hypothetical protein
MKRWTDWEIMRRKVSIAGCIVDHQNNPVRGAQITIAAKAGKFRMQIDKVAWENSEDRPDRTRSRADGLYFFLDIPEGRYMVNAIDPRSGKNAEKLVTVSKDEEKSGRIAKADFTLPD